MYYVVWNGRYSRRKRYEKLLQIQLGILGERDLNPERWLEVVNVNVERRERIVVLVAEAIIGFTKAMLVG